jgi:hypothetical protein
MKTRATLTLEPDLHQKAKRLARLRQTSVSGLFESYLRAERLDEPSRVDALIGSARLKEAVDGPDPRQRRLTEKYLK